MFAAEKKKSVVEPGTGLGVLYEVLGRGENSGGM